MKFITIAYITLCYSATMCMQETSQYGSLVSLGEMEVLAQQVKPEEYKTRLKGYNLTPQAMAACVRYFCKIDTVDEKKEIAYFQNKKDVNYKEYIATGVQFLQRLKDERDGKEQEPFDWAAYNTIHTISKQADERNTELKPKKSCYKEFARCTWIWGLAAVIYGIGGGIGLWVRMTCSH